MAGFVTLDPRFAAMVLPNAPLELLAEGFRWAEGPVWFADHQQLLFSDIPNNRIMRWTEDGIGVFRAPSQYSNGPTRDREGRLLTCSHQNRCVTRTELDGSLTTLADRYQGRRLNAPNDIVVKSDGSIWFTDPHYGINTDYEGGKQPAELPPRVYRLDTDASLHVVAEDFEGPNGLCFSPDESRLYIAEAGQQFSPAPRQCIMLCALAADARALRPAQPFHKIQPGFADGMRCDEQGNVWSSAADGVHCISPQGEMLGKILVPARVSNLAFGGRHRSRLFICAGQRLYAIYTNVRGATAP